MENWSKGTRRRTPRERARSTTFDNTSVKGINLISALYHLESAEGGAFPPGTCVPVAFELVKKSEWIFDKKKQKWRRRSPETKNEAYRRMLSACKDNRLKFRYVLSLMS